MGSFCLPISFLLGLVPGHQLSQRLHGARNFPRYVAVHLGQQILFLLAGTLLRGLPLLLGRARAAILTSRWWCS